MEQAKEGDILNKEERYARLEDYIRILRRAWSSAEPFDWDSKYYKFTQFRWAHIVDSHDPCRLTRHSNP